MTGVSFAIPLAGLAGMLAIAADLSPSTWLTGADGGGASLAGGVVGLDCLWAGEVGSLESMKHAGSDHRGWLVVRCGNGSMA